MKLLLIYTAAEPGFVSLHNQREELACQEIKHRRLLGEQLLGAVDRLWKETGIDPSAIKAIGVVTGPGPFTGLRIGVAVANALALGYGLPVVGVPATEAESADQFRDAVVRRLKAGQAAERVLPEYGRPPSITRAKS